MKFTTLTRIGLPIFLMLLMVACGPNKFTIEGTITDAPDTLIYLEQLGFKETQIIDSAKTDKEGHFKFSQELPEQFPEFYRIRMGNEQITIALDSIQTIKISGSAKNLSANYTIEGSTTSELLKQINQLNGAAIQKIMAVENAMRTLSITTPIGRDSVSKIVLTYKKEMNRLVLANLQSVSAYYALNQTLFGLSVYDPYDAEDLKLYGAIATQFDLKYPNTDRSKYLKSETIQAMKSVRNRKKAIAKWDSITVPIKNMTFEIELPDADGITKKLSSLEGKVVLVCFSNLSEEYSPGLTLKLSELHKKYKQSGFEIYQICFDPDEQYWKSSSALFPWIAVRDRLTIQSSYIQQYNIHNLPTLFIMNRSGEIIHRIERFDQIDSLIKSAL